MADTGDAGRVVGRCGAGGDGGEDGGGVGHGDTECFSQAMHALPCPSLVNVPNFGQRRSPGRSSISGQSVHVAQLLILIGGGIGLSICNVGSSHKCDPGFEGFVCPKWIAPVTAPSLFRREFRFVIRRLGDGFQIVMFG